MSGRKSSLALTALVGSCLLLAGAAAYVFLLGRRGVAYSIVGAGIVLVEWFRHRQSVSPWALFPAVFLIAFYITRARLLAGAAGIHESQTFDLYALYVDGSFGFQPSIWVHHVVAKAVFTEWLFQAVYEALPVAIGVAYASNIARRARWKVFAMMVLVAVVGVQCYKLFPICGPAFLPFGNDCFYFHGSCSITTFFQGVPDRIAIDDRWPRNGMPSLHMSWALLSWWACLRRPRLRYIMLLFAFCTAIATLAYGEHYLIDLAAAVPFSVMMWFLCMDERPFSQAARVFPIVGGALGYLAWVWLLRFDPRIFAASPAIPWLAMLASVGFVFVVIPLPFRRGKSSQSAT